MNYRINEIIRIILLILLVLPLSAISVWAISESDKLNKSVIDSSQDVIKEKVLAKMEIAYQLYSDKEKGAEEHYLQALKLADSSQIDELSIIIGNKIGNIFLQSNQQNKAKYYLTKSTDLAERTNNSKYLMLGKMALANYYINMMYLDSASLCIDKAEKINRKYNYKYYTPGIIDLQASIKDLSGNLNEALDLYFKAVILFEKVGRKTDLATVYNNIAILYLRLDNNVSAIKYLSLAMIINKEESSIYDLNKNIINMGVAYKKLDSIEKAIYYYKKAITFSKKINDEFELARVYMNLGNLVKKTKNIREAKAYYDSSLYICKKNKLDYGILINNINLGDYYIKIGQYHLALNYLIDANKQIQSYRLPLEKSDLNNNLAIVYEKLGLFEQSLHHYKRSREISDSTKGNDVQNKIIELQSKYENEKKKQELTKLQNIIIEEKAQHRMNYVIMLTSLILIIIIGFILYFKRKAHILQSLLTEQENEKLKEIMELKNKEMVSKALNISQINEQLLEASKQIKQILQKDNCNSYNELYQINRQLHSLSKKDSWEEFETRFEQVHESFYKYLAQNHPDLSPTEIKICSLLKLNMSTKDISTLTKRSIHTINNARSSIRKKMNLDSNENITSYLMSI